MMTHPEAGNPLDAELTELHDSYVWIVNAAVSDDRAGDVAQGFPDEALALLSRPR